jgi:hypothetical protein
MMMKDLKTGLISLFLLCGWLSCGGGSNPAPAPNPQVLSHTVTTLTGAGVHTPAATLAVNHGSNIAISFTLDPGYTNLVVSGGNGALSGLTYTLSNVTADVTVQASATAPPVTHTITINAGPGVHTPTNPVTVADGANVTIPFTLDPGYTNLVVTGGTGTLSGLNYTLTNVTTNVTLTASATAPPVTHTITLNLGTGVHTPTNPITLANGANVTIPFTLDPGYTNLVVSGGTGTLAGLNYTLNNVTANVTLTASATAPPVTHTITLNLGSGVHTPTNPITVADGANVTIPFTLDPGYTNLVVSGGTGTLNGLNYTLNNVISNVTLTASATAPPVTHTITLNLGSGVHTPVNPVTVADGANVTIPFTLDAGYTNLVVTGGTGALSGLNYTLNNVTTNVSLTASATAPPLTHTITLNLGTGVHTPANPVTVTDGAGVTIPFTLDAGYTNLVVTGGAGTLSGLNYTLDNVTTDLTLTASATAPVTHTITINLGTGVHTPTSPLTIADGANVTIPFSLDAGYTNLVVTGGTGTLTGLNYTLNNVTANVTLTASATAPVTHTITINLGTGVHTPTNPITVTEGGNVTIPFTLDTGFTNLVVTGGTGTLTGLNYTLTNVTANVTLNASATAPPVTHTITITLGTGVHTPTNPITVTEGGNVTIPFTLDPGYTSLVVTGGMGTLTGLDYTLTNVTANVTLTASATAPPAGTHIVTINAGPGILVPSTTLTIADGATVNFIFTLDVGYRDPVASGMGSGCYLQSARNYICYSAPVTANGVISITAPVDNQYALQYIRCSDNALFVADFTTKPITVSARVGGSGFTVYAVYNASTFGTLPYAMVKQQLYDDGTHGDVTAGDGIYTATFTLTPPPYTRYHDHSVEWMRVDVFAYDASGNQLTSIIDMGTNINIGVIDPAYSAGSAQVASGVYASTNAVNVIIPNLGSSVIPSSTITKMIYQVYPDSFDAIAINYMGNTRAYNGFTGNWPHTDLVKITETGLGIATQDITALYGSAGKLQTVTSLDNDIVGFSFIHEFGHRWCWFLGKTALNLTDISGVHTASPTTIVGQMGNGLFLTEQASGDFIVTNPPDSGFNLGNKFHDWELYLMGFLPPTAPLPERFVLNPSVPQSYGTTIPRASTDLISISGAPGSHTVEGIYGVRSPVAASSQHAFKVLFVAVSDRPLTLAEMSMVNRNAVYYASQIEGRDVIYPSLPDYRTMPTFWSATKYLGTMDTTVPAPK